MNPNKKKNNMQSDLLPHKHGDEGKGATHAVCIKHNKGLKSVFCECSGKNDCGEKVKFKGQKWRIDYQKDMAKKLIINGELEFNIYYALENPTREEIKRVANTVRSYIKNNIKELNQ